MLNESFHTLVSERLYGWPRLAQRAAVTGATSIGQAALNYPPPEALYTWAIRTDEAHEHACRNSRNR